MKPTDRPRFHVDTLRDLAGEKAFARGVSYQRDGQVAILSIEPRRVLAHVAGTRDYRTELTGYGKNIGGTCSCPAFSDYGFCKHMVAAGLAANAEPTDSDAEDTSPLARIRDHLKCKGVDALVEMIVDIAERDSVLFRRLEMAAATVQADHKTLEARLRKLIDGATSTRGFVKYSEAAGWAGDVEAVIDAIDELASNGSATLALKLAERAIDQTERAIEEIDDSEGHCSALLERTRDIHLASARAVRPDPVTLARNLFAREMEGHYATFDRAVRVYADVLGEEGLAEYRRLATASWAKLPTVSGITRERHEGFGQYEQLKDILDFFAERDGDVEARIALRTKDLSSPWRYLQLAEFCLEQRRDAEALQYAEEGLWVFEDQRPDERLVFFAADLLTMAGRKTDAEAHLWRAFEQAPSLDLYRGSASTAPKPRASVPSTSSKRSSAQRRPAAGITPPIFSFASFWKRSGSMRLGPPCASTERRRGSRNLSPVPARQRIRTRRLKLTPSASRGSPTPVAIPHTRKRRRSSLAWPVCVAQPNRRPTSPRSKHATAASAIS